MEMGENLRASLLFLDLSRRPLLPITGKEKKGGGKGNWFLIVKIGLGAKFMFLVQNCNSVPTLHLHLDIMKSVLNCYFSPPHSFDNR